jgi:hypothetical protein
MVAAIILFIIGTLPVLHLFTESFPGRLSS